MGGRVLGSGVYGGGIMHLHGGTVHLELVQIRASFFLSGFVLLLSHYVGESNEHNNFPVCKSLLLCAECSVVIAAAIGTYSCADSRFDVWRCSLNPVWPIS
jgi:uncharacterized membrane protein YjjP (DUF1212 family)